jgi:Holliday junction resolvase RusA-like endonuclease
MQIREFVHGIPKPQPRPRAYSRGGKAGVYNPGTADDWKKAIKLMMKQHKGTFGDNPIMLSMTFHLPRPKSHYGTGKNMNKLKPSAPLNHTQKPDVDNMVKAVMDAITDVGVWKDDSQVVSLSADKYWAVLEPGVFIEIE